MTEPTRYPLAWPVGRPRAKSRKPGNFSTKADTGRGCLQTKEITISQAMDRLEAEVGRLGGRYPLLNSNVETRLDGRPRADRGKPSDPGVCLYFSLKGEPMAMACDAFSEVAQNIAALAGHIEAVRKIERYGVATAAETLQAFQALPPPIPMGAPRRPWHEVFGLDPLVADRESVEALYKAKARKTHPDAGGTAEQMAELNTAREDALRALGGNLEKTQ